MSDVVKVDRQGAVTVFTINRPDKGNAISRAVAADMQAAFVEFDADDAQRVAVITGAGDRNFSAGADVTDLPELWRCIPTVGIQTEKPVIAATSGWVVGGAMVMTMMADLCISSESTKFYYPEAKLGFTGGIISGLAGRIPHKIAMEIMLLGEPIDAARAYQAGLANRIVANGHAVDEAVALGMKMVDLAPLALATMKRFVNDHLLPKGPAELAARFGAELATVRNSADAAEGVRAFREKRKPRYEGS